MNFLPAALVLYFVSRRTCALPPEANSDRKGEGQGGEGLAKGGGVGAPLGARIPRNGGGGGSGLPKRAW